MYDVFLRPPFGWWIIHFFSPTSPSSIPHTTQTHGTEHKKIYGRAFLPSTLPLFTDLIRSIIDHFVTQLDANNPNLELTKAPLLILQSQSQHDAIIWLFVEAFGSRAWKRKATWNESNDTRCRGIQREHAIQVTIMHWAGANEAGRAINIHSTVRAISISSVSFAIQTLTKDMQINNRSRN